MSRYGVELPWINNDARNRALRVLLVGFTLDTLAALALAVYEFAASAGTDVDWRLLPALVLKTLAASAGSYLLRAKLDLSSLPTPLPPVYPGRPADEGQPDGV